MNVTTGVAATTCKLVIYTSDANGRASVLVYESATLSTATTSTFVEATLTQTFTAGVIYWIGVRHSGAATLRAIALGSCAQLGMLTNMAINPATVFRRTLTYATAATNPWSFVNTDRVAGITPTSIRMRVV